MGSDYAIFFIYAILLQFINTAISEDVMTVSHSLESSMAEVKSARCTSPWNLSGRSVVFVEMPAFNHSDLAMQMKIPYLISRWLTKTLYVSPSISSLRLWKIKITSKYVVLLAVQGYLSNLVSSTCILWLHKG